PQVGQKATGVSFARREASYQNARWSAMASGLGIRLSPMTRYPLSFRVRNFKPAEQGIADAIFPSFERQNDHHCFGTATVGHIADDANAGCGWAPGSLRL